MIGVLFVNLPALLEETATLVRLLSLRQGVLDTQQAYSDRSLVVMVPLPPSS